MFPGTILGASTLYSAMTACAAVAAIIVGGEFLLAGSRSEPRTSNTSRFADFDRMRVVARLIGLAMTLGSITAVYALLPEYQGSFYFPFWNFLEILSPVLLLTPLYFIWIDRRIAPAHDAYAQLGGLLLKRRPAELHWPTLRTHITGWAVKAFFLPLMVVYLNGEVRSVFGTYRVLAPNTMAIYHFLYEVAYLIDLLFCVVGYTLTVRALDSHIRSTEPTAFGWVIALICYQPFYSVIGGTYLRYDDGLFWDNWLTGFPVVQAIWGTVIIALLFIYSLSTAAFGLRFSNLTHRGIITRGPYRYTKHPAYLSKNLSWWLISVPFISNVAWYEAIRNCCLLGLINLVYFLRARTEERHLSRDPEYVAYAQRINEHGLLRPLARYLPFLRYTGPQAPLLPIPGPHTTTTRTSPARSHAQPTLVHRPENFRRSGLVDDD
jgi:protein-S-isoprenylcysteine O-methyltransferase Ste14